MDAFFHSFCAITLLVSVQSSHDPCRLTHSISPNAKYSESRSHLPISPHISSVTKEKQSLIA